MVPSQAIEHGISAVSVLGSPLRSAQQVDALNLGEKTSEKIKEILATGTYSRNEILANDAQQQVERLALLCSPQCSHLLCRVCCKHWRQRLCCRSFTT